jgi:YD repeat-containing protein
MSKRDSRDLRSSWWSRPCGAVLLGLALTPTAALAGQARTDYVYDDLGRLVRVERGDGTVITYEYDPAGNIVRHVVMADQDGDGSPNHADCAPSNPNVYPGAPEINDGLDSGCPGDFGYGLIDEVTGTCRFAADKSSFSCDAQAGATVYQPTRSSAAHFSTDCASWFSPTSGFVVAEAPAAGVKFFYLMRAVAPNTGSWGALSSGVERTVCP